MFLRVAVLSATIAGLSLGAPEPTKYRIEQQLENRIDLSAFGQGEQVQNQSFIWFLTITYRDSAGGTVIHAVADSAQIDLGMMPIPAATLDSLKGTAFHGWMDAAGRMGPVTMSRESSLALQIDGALKGFHPRVKPNARSGDSWVDTLQTDSRTAQGTNATRTVTTYTMGGAESVGGITGTRLEATFVATQTGTLETPAGPAEIEGKANGTGTYVIGRNGRYLAGTSSSSGEALIKGGFAPLPIPVKTQGTTTVSIVQ